MRITPVGIFNRLMKGFQRNFTDVYEANGKLSTGRRINRPSDDVIGMAKAMGYKVSINSNDQFSRNIDEAVSRLSFTEVIMQSVSENLMRAKELTVQAATATQNAESRRAIAQEVDNLKEQMLNFANSQLNGKYVFSGYKTATPAFNPATLQYQGDSGVTRVMLDKDSSIGVNVPGDSVFKYVLEAEEAVQLEDGRYLHFMPGETVLEGADIAAPGIDSTLQFTVTGRLGSASLTVNIAAVDDQASIAAKIMDAVNAEAASTGVSARDGGGGTAVDLYDPGRGSITVSGIDAGSDEDLWSGFPEGSTTAQAADAVYVEIREPDDSTVTDSFSFDNFMEMLDVLTRALNDNNVPRVEALLRPLDDALGQVLNVQADMGARLNRLDAQKESLLDNTLMLKENLSAAEDADITETAIDLSKAQLALTALRDSSGRLLSQSLMDFLK
jgi:flagellar hook-associated protein 3